MSGFSRTLVLTVAVLLVVPLAALSELTPEERAANQRRVEKWRADHDHFARLRADARAFLDLPPERQEQLLKLDRDLAALPPFTQARLLQVGKRYADWLDRLPEAQRQQIKELQGQRARRDRIQQLREQEWIRRLPQAYRDRVETAQGGDRARLIQQYRKEERQRRRDWQIAFQHWEELTSKKHPLPATLADFPPEVQTYVTEYLRPRLSPDERARLDKADGRWPDFPYTLVELADKHPMALPGPTGPTRVADLPVEVLNRLAARMPGAKKNAKQALKKVELALKKYEGKWPEFAIGVTTLARKHQTALPYELWPSQRDDLSVPVKEFLTKRLLPLLDEREKAQLKEAEWKWPLYPRTIEDLAQKHTLEVPWQTLPTLAGQRKSWDSYRLHPILPADAPANPVLLKP
jgi:hypothetical protein